MEKIKHVFISKRAHSLLIEIKEIEGGKNIPIILSEIIERAHILYKKKLIKK